LVLVIVAVVLLGGGVAAGSRIKSPRQAIADAQPPPLSIVTASLEMRALVDQVVTRGRPTKGGGVNLTAPGALAGADSVVTDVRVRRGEKLRDAQVIFEVSGAPVLTAQLPFRPFRDVLVGTRGPDVRAISSFLTRHGYLGGGRDVADTAMRQAAWRLFSERGYPSLLGGKSGDTSGLVMKQSWLLRTDRVGRKVSHVPLAVGSEVSGPDVVLVVCDATPPAVRALVDKAAAGRLRVADQAMIVDDATNRSVPATVSAIGSADTTDRDTGASGRPVTLQAADGASFSGLPDDLKVTIDSAVAPEPVLAAPTTAVYTDESGASRVTLADGDRRGADVAIKLGPCVAGWCQILSTAAPLTAGTTVVAGTRGAGHP
jgi:hypothetical protein